MRLSKDSLPLASISSLIQKDSLLGVKIIDVGRYTLLFFKFIFRIIFQILFSNIIVFFGPKQQVHFMILWLLMMEGDSKFKLANSNDWHECYNIGDNCEFPDHGAFVEIFVYDFLSQDFHVSFDRDIFSLEISRSLNYVICFIFSLSC